MTDVNSLLLLTNEASGGCVVFWNQPFLLFSRTGKIKDTTSTPQKELSKSSTLSNFERRHCACLGHKQAAHTHSKPGQTERGQQLEVCAQRGVRFLPFVPPFFHSFSGVAEVARKVSSNSGR